MLNIAVIVGRLTKDPELKVSANGKSMAPFSIACVRDYKSKDTDERATDFFNCIAFNHTAEYLVNYLHKGDTIAVEGRLQNGVYVDKDGITRQSMTLVANSVQSFTRSKRTMDDDFSELTDDDEGLPF